MDALAEVEQPHMFIAQIDLGGRILVPYIVIPPEDTWVPMRLTAEAACIGTAKVVFVGGEAAEQADGQE